MAPAMPNIRWNPFKRTPPAPAAATTVELQVQPSSPRSPSSSSNPLEKVLTEEDAYHVLGFQWSSRKKWAILTSVFICQLSMNFNAAIYSTAIDGLSETFKISQRQAELGQMIFLVCYAFGCEAWAPWSEELGRKWVMQISLFLVNLTQIGCALAPNFATVMAFRAIGGLSSAGGSVTLGMVADLFEPENQQQAVNYVVLSSVMGSVLAPIFGGPIKAYLDWPWAFWVSLIFGSAAQFIHWFVPETRATILLDNHAKALRKSGENPNVVGPNEKRGTFWQRISLKEIATLMWRPYKFLYSEPIVTFLSLLSGFSDALIFTGLDSFGMVMGLWHFDTIQIGLSFIPLALGYIACFLIFMKYYSVNRKIEAERTAEGKVNQPERRLYPLLYLVLLEPIGLLIYGCTSLGPRYSHWAGPLIASGLIGLANAAIYQATVDYMIASYGAYSSSATGGNGFCRDLLAGMAALYARPLFTNIMPETKWQLPIPTFILFVIGVFLTFPVFIFYFKGEWFRMRSPFAQELADKRGAARGLREHAIEDAHAHAGGSKNPSRQASRAPSMDAQRLPQIPPVSPLPMEAIKKVAEEEIVEVNPKSSPGSVREAPES